MTLFGRWGGYTIPSVKRSRWIIYLPALSVLLTAIHLVVESGRWQMVPAYCLTIVFFFQDLTRLKKERHLSKEKPSQKIWAMIGFLGGLLIIVLVTALPILFPIFQFPAPEGPYPVGTTNLHLVDQSRPETFTPIPDDKREFMVKIWYPAEVEPGAKPDAYLEHLPFQLSHLALVKTHAYQDVPVSAVQSSFPVLIFSHGYIGLVDQNLTLMEELASQGYIVCSIAHTYQAQATVFPDGRNVPVDLSLSTDFLKGIAPTQSDYGEHLRIWTDDTLYLMDELEKIQLGEQDLMLTDKLDLDRIGVFGMSFGGVAAVQVCSEDSRCHAGINLDAGLPRDYSGRAIESPLNQPFLFMLREDQAAMVHTNMNAVENTAYGIRVRGTTHLDFTDLFLYLPVLKYTNIFGPIDGYHMIDIIKDYTVAFFDEYLKGESSTLLNDLSPDYPEVEIKIKVP